MIRGMLIGAMITSFIIFIGNYSQTADSVYIENARVGTRILMLIIFVVCLCGLIGSYM